MQNQRLRYVAAWVVSSWCLTAAAEIDLRPIVENQWTLQHAAHLASRAGFGADASTLRRLAAATPREAVHTYTRAAQDEGLAPFEHSGVFDAGLEPFPPSRPATTELARRQGHALGVAVKAGGNRPLQPVVNQFFYWLRASRLETDRVAYWWAQRMLTTADPLRERVALFWHGHFATNEDKVRDYRKMLQQVRLFQSAGLGNFGDLLVQVAKDPAMLVFLDAGVNTKDSPNENFAREILELFSMGVGHYGEHDVQEAARAFTGWNVDGLDFQVIDADHDTARKQFLGRNGNFDGEDIINIILEQAVTAEFIAAKLYRHFVSEDLAAADEPALGAALRNADYNIRQYLETLFLSRDFFAPANVGSRVKGPVELMISTYRHLGLVEVPGVPDFNVVSEALGQRLMHPPTVAGWSEGRSWITPSLLFERANFVLDVLFPDIGFVPPDRYPGYLQEIVNVQQRLRQGMSIAAATKPTGVESDMSASNLLADRDEDFNTRLGSMRGWQMALERVEPIPRRTARIELTALVVSAGLRTPREVVDYFNARFFSVPLDEAVSTTLGEFLQDELGTDDIASARSYLEEPLRRLLHVMLSLPDYQLG